MDREWKPVTVPGYEKYYEVSNYGEVRSVKTGHKRLLKNKYNKRTGYTYIILGYNGKSVTRSVHRLVAEAFIPNAENKPQVNHIDEDKTNNRADNLEWVTAHENNEHSKYKRYKPLELRNADGELLATFTSEKALADVLGVARTTIAQTAKGRTTNCCGYLISYKDGD